MVTKNRIPKALALLIAPLGIAKAYADPLSYGLELQAGQTSVVTSKNYEIDKSGSSIGEMLFLNGIRGDWIWGLGAGGMSSRLDGSQSGRGVKQELSVDLFFLDLRYLYRVNTEFSIGPSVRAYYGKGAAYGVTDNNNIAFLLSPGAVAKYEWKNIQFSPAASFSYYFDANVGSRRIQTFLFGISLSTTIAEEKKREKESWETPAAEIKPNAVENDVKPVPTPVETAAPDAPATAAPDSSEPELLDNPPADSAPSEPQLKPASETKVSADIVSPELIDPIVFSFASSSSQLSGDAKAKLEDLAQILVIDGDAWSKIVVSGHTDKLGSAELNKKLSQERAESLCEILIGKGIPREKLNCVGKDFQELLPGVPSYSSKHRRIELVFKDYDAAKSGKLKRDIDHALQK